MGAQLVGRGVALCDCVIYNYESLSPETKFKAHFLILTKELMDALSRKSREIHHLSNDYGGCNET